MLSKLGYCSRSRATELIRAGHVSINGRIQRNPETPVVEKQGQVAVDGNLVEREEKIYLMMNKPRGVVTTAFDEKGRDTVYTVLSSGKSSAEKNSLRSPIPWLAPIGRLDKASEGFLLLTNDSKWGARIADPGTHLDKTYHVQVATIADEDFVEALVRGVRTSDGEVLRAKQARLLRGGRRNCWLEIVLDEGRNRQIRRMMRAMGINVLRLVRVAIGPLQLGDLPKGEYRALLAEEKSTLDRALGTDRP